MAHITLISLWRVVCGRSDTQSVEPTVISSQRSELRLKKCLWWNQTTTGHILDPFCLTKTSFCCASLICTSIDFLPWYTFSLSVLKAHYSTGRVCASFTSTAMTPVTTHEAGEWTSRAPNTGKGQKHTFCRLLMPSSVHAGTDFVRLGSGAASLSRSVQLCLAAAQPQSCSTGSVLCNCVILYDLTVFPNIFMSFSFWIVNILYSSATLMSLEAMAFPRGWW